MTRAEHRKRMEEVVAEWRRSGIPAEEMAAKAKVSVGTLWQWRKLVGPARQGQGAIVPPVRFLPVQLLGGIANGAAESERAGHSMELVLKSGTRVVIPEGFSTDSLERLLAVVVRTC